MDESREHREQPADRRAWRGSIGLFLVVVTFLAGWIRLGPLPNGFLDPNPHRSTLITDRYGETIYESLSSTEQRSHWIAADEIPATVEAATLAAEDHRFFMHSGVDPIALGRALMRDVIAGRFVEGGSTITQQTIKQILIARGDPARRTVGGKLREMVLALRLEHRLNKREILALYLNLAPYGNQYVGIERASTGYFGTAPANLTPAQAALLAGLPRKPSALDPWTRGDAARSRQQRVLRRMEDEGFLTGEESAHARAERLVFRRPERAGLAPHFVERVLSHPSIATQPRIRTTLDLGLQREIVGILGMHARALDGFGAHNVAVAVLDNASGEWLAWVGSRDYFDARHGGAIDAVITPRQPGSALKPFTYALAFDAGFAPSSALPDVEIDFPTAEDGIRYKPRNYDGVYRGPLRARAALAGSENVPAVWLLSKIGPQTLLSSMRASGFSTLDRDAAHYGLGLTLGDAEVRLDELTAAYAMLARGGEPARTTMLDGQPGVIENTALVRSISPRSAFWVTDILSDRRAREFVFGAGGPLDFPFQVAVKTGTSQAYRDNWTIGYTRELTVGVWVGNVDRTPLRSSSGVTGAAPIFHDVMMAAIARRRHGGPLEDRALLSPVEGLERREICAISGDQPSAWCQVREKEWIVTTATRRVCGWHDERGVDWPPEYRHWAAARGLLHAEQMFGGESVASAVVGNERPLQIVNPGADALYWIDPTLRPEFQTVALRAIARGGGTITWLIDDVPIGSAPVDRPLDWPLRRGTHEIIARDSAGNQDAIRITVR